MKTLWFYLILLTLVTAGLESSGLAAQKVKKPASVEEELRLKAGEDKTNDEKSLKAELLIERSEKNAMDQLQKLLVKHRGTQVEPDLHFRKAELFLRQARSTRFFEMNQDGGGIRFSPKLLTSASSKNYAKKALETYDLIQKKFPEYRDMDSVLFNNAFTRQTLGDNKNAEVLYKAVVDKFPDSALIPDSHLALGEMLFEKKEFDKALTEFEKIKKYPTARVYPYGVYKSGWTKYNLRDTKGAIAELEEVVRFGKKIAEENGDGRLDLRREALNDIVLFFEEAHTSEKAFAYFRTQAGDEWVGSLMLRLSRLYEHHSRYKDLERVLADYISKMPMSLERPMAHRDLANSFEIQNRRSDALEQLKEMQKVCLPKSDWSKKFAEKKAAGGEEELRVDCDQILKESSLKYASKWHKSWLLAKNQKDLSEAARTAYEIYLSAPSPDEKARYTYAELLFQSESFREASAQYALVSQESKDPKTIHDASYAACVSFEKSIKDKWSDNDEEKFVKLAIFYTEKNPKGDFVSDINFKRGFIAYEKGRYDEAAEVFKVLGTKGKEDVVVKAQDLYMDILNLQKKFKALKEYSRELISKNSAQDRKIGLTKIYHESSFAEAQQVEERGQFDEATAMYKKFAAENPDSKLSEKALWNSVQILGKIGKTKELAFASQHFYKTFPKSEHAKDVLISSAKGFEELGLFKEAAETVEDLALVDNKNASGWKLLAADFKYFFGDREGAKKIYRKLSADDDKVTAELAQEKLFYFETKTLVGESLKRFYVEISKSSVEPFATQAELELIKAKYEAGSDSDAFRDASGIVARRNKLPAHIVAGARMIQAKILEKEFKAQSVKAKADRITMVLALKTEKLDKVQQAYQDVIKFKDAKTSVEALRRLADCYGHYGKAVRTLPIPEEVSGKEREIFVTELEKLAIPMEEKNVETLNLALVQAKKANLRDGTIADIQIEMNKLNLKQNSLEKAVIQVPPPLYLKVAGGDL